MKEKKELSVGLFAAAGIALFAVFVFSVGKFAGPSRQIRVEFGYLDGLAPDAPVQYAGYRVGKVEEIDIPAGEPVRILATLSIPKGLPVRRTTEVIITSMGLMGEKVVEILPSPDGDALPEGEVLRGTDPILLSRMFGQVRTLFDANTSGNIRQVAENVVRLTEDLTVFSSTLRKISLENGDDIHRILNNLSASSDHLPGVLTRAENTTVKIDKAAEALSQLAENLKGISSENRPEIHQIVKNLNATSENLKALSTDIRRHPWKLVRKGRGSDGSESRK